MFSVEEKDSCLSSRSKTIVSTMDVSFQVLTPYFVMHLVILCQIEHSVVIFCNQSTRFIFVG